MTQKQRCYYTVKRVRCVKQRKKLSLFEIVKQLHEYTSAIDIRNYDEEKILLMCLQFIVKKLKKKHALKKSQLQADKDEHSTEVFTVDKATNTALNKHIRFLSSSDSERSEDEHEEQVGVNEKELMKIRKTYEKHIELLLDKIRKQHHKGITTDERSTVFVTSSILMAIFTSSWLYCVIYNFVSEEQGNIIFSNILFVQIVFIVLSVRCCM